MRAANDPINATAMGFQLSHHALVDIVHRLGWYHSPAHDSLISYYNDGQSQSAQGGHTVFGTRQKSKFFPTLNVIRSVLTNYTITIKENGSHSFRSLGEDSMKQLRRL